MITPLKRSVLFLFLLTLIAGCSGTPPKSPAHKSRIQQSTVHKSGSRTSGKASYYADKYQGRQTASGERFDQKAMTAAHRTLPFGTKVKVTNVRNGKSVLVRINDRGPFVKGRIIDLSRSAFASIGSPASGVIGVEIEVIR
jgi:rare lipoprotein A